MLSLPSPLPRWPKAEAKASETRRGGQAQDIYIYIYIYIYVYIEREGEIYVRSVSWVALLV